MTPPTPVHLKAAERVEIVTLMENYSDLLLKSEGVVTRPPHGSDGKIPRDTLMAEHGLSLLVSVYREQQKHSILFDTGHTEIGVLHNLRYLERDRELKDIEAIVLSHGHMDHTGSLYPVLAELRHPVPVVVHPGAFHCPRFILMKDGTKAFFPDTLKREELSGAGAEIRESRDPLLLAGDMVLVTGEVERTTSFEKGMPNTRLERNGAVEKDAIKDDQALVIHLRDKGLVVISGCAHAGIVNTILYGRKLTGIEVVDTIIGGFHLSGPAFESIVEPTIEAVREMNPRVVVPMHCTGWKAVHRFAEAFPEAFVLNSVGAVYTLV